MPGSYVCLIAMFANTINMMAVQLHFLFSSGITCVCRWRIRSRMFHEIVSHTFLSSRRHLFRSAMQDKILKLSSGKEPLRRNQRIRWTAGSMNLPKRSAISCCFVSPISRQLHATIIAVLLSCSLSPSLPYPNIIPILGIRKRVFYPFSFCRSEMLATNAATPGIRWRERSRARTRRPIRSKDGRTRQPIRYGNLF